MLNDEIKSRLTSIFRDVFRNDALVDSESMTARGIASRIST
jgi:hypothetical protein